VVLICGDGTISFRVSCRLFYLVRDSAMIGAARLTAKWHSLARLGIACQRFAEELRQVAGGKQRNNGAGHRDSPLAMALPNWQVESLDDIPWH